MNTGLYTAEKWPTDMATYFRAVAVLSDSTLGKMRLTKSFPEVLLSVTETEPQLLRLEEASDLMVQLYAWRRGR